MKRLIAAKTYTYDELGNGQGKQRAKSKIRILIRQEVRENILQSVSVESLISQYTNNPLRQLLMNHLDQLRLDHYDWNLSVLSKGAVTLTVEDIKLFSDGSEEFKVFEKYYKDVDYDPFSVISFTLDGVVESRVQTSSDIIVNRFFINQYYENTSKQDTIQQVGESIVENLRNLLKEFLLYSIRNDEMNRLLNPYGATYNRESNYAEAHNLVFNRSGDIVEDV